MSRIGSEPGRLVPLIAAVILLVTLGDSAFFSSRPRFLLPAFPLLIPAAVGLDRLRSRPLAHLVLASLAVACAGYGAYAFFVSPGAP